MSHDHKLDRQALRAAEIVAGFSLAQRRNMAAFRSGHHLSIGALRGLRKKGALVQMDDGGFVAVLLVMDVFNEWYPRP